MRSTARKCSSLGLLIYLAQLVTGKAMSGRDFSAGYIRDPTSCWYSLVSLALAVLGFFRSFIPALFSMEQVEGLHHAEIPCHWAIVMDTQKFISQCRVIGDINCTVAKEEVSFTNRPLLSCWTCENCLTLGGCEGVPWLHPYDKVTEGEATWCLYRLIQVVDVKLVQDLSDVPVLIYM